MRRSTLPAPLPALTAPLLASQPRAAAAASPVPPRLIAGRFQVEGLIAVGGMGSVYRARDVTLDEVVALKIIAREISSVPGMIERFRREVKLARRVTHRNVARCFDIGEDGGDSFFTMELVEGESLGARVAREYSIAPAEAITIALEVCAGLAAAHRASVVHRDLKPDNVLLARDGRVVLTDFGIASARLPTDGPSRTMGIIMGTPEYMAPEQAEGQRDVDGRADIYSLGTMMYELVTGTSAWMGPTPMAIVVARLENAPPDPRQRATISDGLAEVILRCMARRREDRYPTVDSLAKALQAVQQEVESTRTEPGAPHKSKGTPVSTPLATVPGRSLRVRVQARDRGQLAQATAEGLAALVQRYLGAATSAAGPREAAFVVDSTVVLDGDRVVAHVQLVEVADGAVLYARRHEAARSELFVVAGSIAADVAGVLMVDRTPTLPNGIADPEALDLWLAAGAEARKTGAIARDRAVAAFERAISRTPDDPWVLSGYAAALVERFHEAETPSADLLEAVAMAERVIDATGALGEAWLARAMARFELGDSRGAVTDLARAHRALPGAARAHSLRGRMHLEAGDPSSAKAHFERAAWLEPSLEEPRLSMALAAGMAGERAVAESLVNDVLEAGRPSEDALVTAGRLALWNADVDRARALRKQVDPLRTEHDGRARHVLDAVLGEGAEGTDFFAWLAGSDPVAARRSLAARRIEAELAAAGGDLGRTLDAVQAAVSTTGFFDLGWLDGCPLLRPVRAAPRFVALRTQVLAARREVLEMLDATREE